MSKLVHFEIPVNDMQKSMKFYADTFGWKFTPYIDAEYYMAECGPTTEAGINGGLMKRRDPNQPISSYISVSNIDDAEKTITKNGGQIVVPKSPIPGVGYFAFFKDPEGTIVGIYQDDTSAQIPDQTEKAGV